MKFQPLLTFEGHMAGVDRYREADARGGWKAGVHQSPEGLQAQHTFYTEGSSLECVALG